MREIKFRAWDKRGSFMYLVREMFWLNKGLTVDDGATIREAVVGDNTDLMQYTGLKDKNGKEVYEGDIVKVSDIWKISNYEVYWDDRAQQFRLRANGDNQYDKTRPLTFTREVIGNIYENPELLK